MNGLKSNIALHTQIICFDSGRKKTIKNIIRIDEGEMLTLTTVNGVEYLIPKHKVEWVERYSGSLPIPVIRKKKKKVISQSYV